MGPQPQQTVHTRCAIPSTLRLGHGQFIGTPGRTHSAAGFSFVEIVHTSTFCIPSHTHDDAHFVLILEGDYVTEARNRGTETAQPKLIFNPPGTSHRDHFRSDTGRFFAISLLPDLFSRLPVTQSPIDHPVAFGNGDEATLATRIFAELRHSDALSHLVIEGLGLELLAHTARKTRQKRRKAHPPWFDRAIELMRESRSIPITVRDVAAEIGVHPYHLTRVTRAVLGKSPGEVLRGHRIHEAVQLLTKTRGE